MVFENSVFRRILDLRGTTREGIIKSLMLCTAHPMLCSDKIERNEMGGGL